jgi:small GTP-binding protein
MRERGNEIKTILIGDCNTGKSTLYASFINGVESGDVSGGGVGGGGVPTVAFDFGWREVVTPSYGRICFKLWDTSGAEKFNTLAMTQTFYRNTEGVLLVFDLTNRESFENISEVWLRRVRSSLTIDPSYKCILIGNKSDLTTLRQVPTEEALALSQQLGMQYVEISSLHSHQREILQPFLMLAVQVMDERGLRTSRREDDVLVLGGVEEVEEERETKRCCAT